MKTINKNSSTKTNGVKRILALLLTMTMVLGLMPNGLSSPQIAKAQMSTAQKTRANFIAVAAGSYHAVALDDEGFVYSWANERYSMLGRSFTTDNRNKATRLTATDEPGVPTLPFIRKISASDPLTLALDLNGDIWSWGNYDRGEVNLGRPRNGSGLNNPMLPKKVVMPNGVKAIDIAASINGGRFIGTDGSIWVWGSGYNDYITGNGYALGTGVSEQRTRPVKLTQAEGGAALPTNFVQIEASDYGLNAAAIAITADNKIYTWSTNSDAAGGSKRPMLVNGGWATPIKKIDCGCGFWGVLDKNGDLWTWGSNIAMTSNGRLGLNRANGNPAKTPEKITTVTRSGSNVAAPKFKDFSMYAWCDLALDVNGIVYGAGENVWSSHSGSPNVPEQNRYFTEFRPSAVPSGTDIYMISEGYVSSCFIDSSGNLYANSSLSNMKSGATSQEPWVHLYSHVPLFTSIVSTPGENTKVHTGTKAGAVITLSEAADEVKYVILYPDSTHYYSDGKRYYDKSFYELEAPYYLQGSGQKVLISPNASEYTGRYYANPQITEAVFNAAYTAKQGVGESGLLTKVSSTQFKIDNKFGEWCIVWFQSKIGTLTNRIMLTYNNYYTKSKVWVRGVNKANQAQVLYSPKLVPGNYGLPLNRNKNALIYTGTGDPMLGWDVVQPNQPTVQEWPTSALWILDPANQTAQNASADKFGVKHRTDPTKEVILNNISQYTDVPADNTTVTFTYSKNPNLWINTTIKYVDEYGSPIDVWHTGDVYNSTPDVLSLFAPIGNNVRLSEEDPYTPPEPDIDTYSPEGYTIGAASVPNGPGTYTQCEFPAGFNPSVTAADPVVYIVYKQGLNSVTESFYNSDPTVPTAITNDLGQLSNTSSHETGTDVNKHGPSIFGRVYVGYEITNKTSNVTTPVAFTWVPSVDPFDHGDFARTPIQLDNIQNSYTIKYLYKTDADHNGVPDDMEGEIMVQWIGVHSDGSTSLLKSAKVMTVDGVTKIYPEDKARHLAEPDKWVLAPAAKYQSYLPAGDASPKTVVVDRNAPQTVTFYYNADANENGILDEEETITVKYRLYGDDVTPLQNDDVLPFVLGNDFTGIPDDVAGYWPIGWYDGDYDATTDDSDLNMINSLDDYVYVDKKTGTLPNNPTITFIYKKIGAPITINFRAVTYAGTVIGMPPLILTGLVGEDLTYKFYSPFDGDSLWVINPAQSILPSETTGGGITTGGAIGSTSSGGITSGGAIEDLTSGGAFVLARRSLVPTETPQNYLYTYKENLTMSMITHGGKSTDDKINIEFTKKELPNAAPHEITADEIPNYRVTGYTLYDEYDNPIRSGPEDHTTIDPSMGNQRLMFTYVCLDTTVYIKCLGPNGEVLNSFFKTDARVGDTYAAIAPYVTNYALDDTLVKTIPSVASGTNIMEFHYEPRGKVVINLCETGKTMPVKTVNVTKAGISYSVTDLAAELAGAYYTYNAAETRTKSETSTRSGITLPLTISDVSVDKDYDIYFDKVTVPVLVQRVDENDLPIDTDIRRFIDDRDEWLRAGEMGTVATEQVLGYTLQERSSKAVLADPNSNTATPQIVKFVYKQNAVGNVRVLYYYDGDETKVLDDFTVQAELGSTFKVSAPAEFPGFKLDEANDTQMIQVEASNPTIKFNYKDVRHTVFVTTGFAPVEPYRVVSGEAVTIQIPHIPGHVLSTYDVDYLSNKQADVTAADGTSKSSITLNNITENVMVSLSYMTVDQAASLEYAIVTIAGESNGKSLYSYEKRIAKAALPYDLQDGAEVFAVPDYILDPAQDHRVTQGGIKTFRYTSTDATVKITLVDNATSAVLNSFNAVAAAGQPFSYVAPYYPAYQLLPGSDLYGMVPRVLANGSSELVFKYEKIRSKVTVIAKEKNTGITLGAFEVANPMANAPGVSVAPAPDLSSAYYTLVNGEGNVNASGDVAYVYDGTNASEAVAYYTKNIVNVAVKTVDESYADLGGGRTLTAREGEVIMTTAPAVANYVLLSNTRAYVVADGSNEAEFRYRKITSGTVMVNVYENSTRGALLYNYTIPATPGAIVTIDPATVRVRGYERDPNLIGERLSVKSGDGEDIIVLMRDVRHRVAVVIAPAATGVETPVVSGDGLKVQVPYVAGHVLDSYDITYEGGWRTPNATAVSGKNKTAIDLTGIRGNVKVTLNYITVDQAANLEYDVVKVVGESNGLTLYSYEKRIAKTALPYELMDGTDVFAVPGYLLVSGQDHRITPADAQAGIKTFRYASTAATVKITLKDDTTSAVLNAFNVQAMAGQPYSYTAPYYPAYQLADTVSNAYGLVPSVLADGSSEIVFRYKRIQSKVTMLAKEEGTNTVLGVFDIASPSIGNRTAVPPDLRKAYYEVVKGAGAVDASGLVDYNYDGFTSTEVTVYYKKELINLAVKTADDISGSDVSGGGNFDKPLQRKGDPILVTAPDLSANSYNLVSNSPIYVIADGTTAAAFRYRSAIAGTVTVNVYAGSTAGAIIYSYGIPAKSGDTVTVDPDTISVAGYNRSGYPYIGGERLSVTYDSRQDIKVVMSDVRHTVTVVTSPLASSTEYKVVSGEALDVQVPYVPGQVIDKYDIVYTSGQRNVTGAVAASMAPIKLTNITEDVTVTFKYITVDQAANLEYAVVKVVGESNGVVLYSHERRIAKTDLPYDLQDGADVFAVPRYTLDAVQDHRVTQAGIKTFRYTSTDATVKITLVDNTNSVLNSFNVEAEAGQPYSYTAPYYPAYKLVSAAYVKINSVLADSSSEIVFMYEKIQSKVTIKAMDQENGSVIGLYEITNPVVGAPTAVNAPDLSGAYYTPVPGNQSVTYSFNGSDAAEVTAYYIKDKVVVEVRTMDDAYGSSITGGGYTLPPQRKGEVISVTAPDLTGNGYVLVSNPSVYVVAEDGINGAIFRYRSMAGGTVRVNVYDADSATGAIIHSYNIPARAGDTIVVDPATITVAGYDRSRPGSYTKDRLSVTYDSGQSIMVGMSDVRHRVTVVTDPAGGATGYKAVNGSNLDVTTPYVPGYVFDTYGIVYAGGGQADVTNADGTGKAFIALRGITEDVTVSFKYITVEEAANRAYVNITIKGVTGSVEHYSYAKRFARSNVPATLDYRTDLFAVPGYRLVPGQTLSVTPDGNSLVASFNYVSNTAAVKIAAVYDDGVYRTPVESFTNVYVTAEAGKEFAFVAPAITGFNNTGSGTNPITVTGSGDTITFYYEKGVGSLTVIAKEGNDVIGQTTKNINAGDTVPVNNSPTAAEIPALAYYDLTAAPGLTSSGTYNGVNPVTAEYQYTRKKANVKLVAMNSVTNTEITSVDAGAQRVLEEYVLKNKLSDLDGAVAGIGNGFTRLVGVDKIRVSMNAADNQIAVWYAPPQSGRIPVEMRLGSKTGELVQSYFIPAAAGERVSLSGGLIPSMANMGYVFNESGSALSAVEGMGGRIVLVYDDARKEIKIFAVKDNGAPVLYDVKKVVAGSDAAVLAPFMAGYVLTDYKENNNGIAPIPYDFKAVSFAGVSGANEVTFYYKGMAEYVQEQFVNVQVRGISKYTETELYRYTVLRQKNSGSMEVNAFDVNGYRLEDPSPATVNVGETDQTVTFRYETLATTVTINMVDKNGDKIAASFSTNATEDSAFSYNAPNVAGYYLTDASSIGIVDSVSGSGDSELTFTYERISSNVTIVAKEQGTDRVIRVIEVANPTLGTALYSVLDLRDEYYTAVNSDVSITYDGTNKASADAYYTKDLTDVTVNTVEDRSGSVLGAAVTLSGQRKGEAVAVGAPYIADHVLLGTASQMVIADNGQVTFRYRTLGVNDVVVKAKDKDSEYVLQSYVISGATGETLRTRASSIFGWLPVGGITAKSAVVGTDREIVFEYVKNMVTVTVNTVDENGDPVMPPQMIEVPNGGDYTVYAPHISGYSLTSRSSQGFAAMTANVNQTFTYEVARGVAEPTVGQLTVVVKTASTDRVQPNASVWVRHDGKTDAYTTDADGKVVLSDLSFGTYSVEAGYGDYNRASSNVVLSAANANPSVTLSLGRTTTVASSGGGSVSTATATLYIYGEDVKSGSRIYQQNVKVVVGSKETVKAPMIEGYELASGSPLSESITIRSSDNLVTFSYVYVGDKFVRVDTETVKTVKNDDEVSSMLETSEHIKYINGYWDNSMKPDYVITREEVATIFFRLLRDKAKDMPVGSGFSDVESDRWSAQAINYLANIGILKGYWDGEFKPGQYITRAEFVAMASRLADMSAGGGNPFSDVDSSHWAYSYILSANVKGWISGYPGGEFRPGNNITRAEVVTVVNKMLGRKVLATDIPAWSNASYIDLPRSHWAYADILESSVDHDYAWLDNGYESWTVKK